jgi:glycine C-acetyltransferase
MQSSETSIIPAIIGNDALVKEMTRRLHQAGVVVNTVPYPAVPKKLTRIRITVSAKLTKAHMGCIGTNRKDWKRDEHHQR